MKRTVEEQINGMKAQTFGVEVEGNNITREHAAQVAAAYFGTNHYAYTANVDGYYTWSAWDQQGRKWKFQRDVSIVARNDNERTELVTPILRYEDIETLQELLRRLRRAGAKSDPKHMCPHSGGRDESRPCEVRPYEVCIFYVNSGRATLRPYMDTP